MRLCRAEEKDSEKLKEFFSEQKVPGVITYSVDRHGSFFDKYRLQSDDFVTFMMVDHNEQIQGVATLVFRKARLNQVEQVVAYAMDLRITKSRKAVMLWTQLFLDAFYQEAKERESIYTFSVIERTESAAYNALIRPRQSRRKLPRYYLFRQFYAVSIHGKWPLLGEEPITSLTIRNADINDAEEIHSYLEAQKEGKTLSFPLSFEEFIHRIKNWRGLDWSDFIIAKDADGNICGCVAPWESEHIQTYKIHEYSGRSHLLYQGLIYASLLGFANKLPSVGDAIEPVILTHLAADNPDIFHALLENCYQKLNDRQFLLYGTFKGDYNLRPPRSYIFAQIPYGLYSVLRPQQNFPDFLRPNPWSPAPDLELAEI